MLLSRVRRQAVAFVVALSAALALVFALWPTTAGATASNQVKAPNDAKISQANPDTPAGQDPTVRVSGSSSVGLFKFTTASLSIPTGATLNEVFVQMFLDPTSTAANGDQLRLYESTCFTSEDTVTWNTRPTRLDLLATRDVFNQSGTLRPSVTFSYTDLTALNTGSPTCLWVESTNAATTVEVESHENGDTAKQAVLWVDYTTNGTTTTTQPPPGGTKVMAAGDLCDPDAQVPTNNPTCEGPADLVTTYNAERWIPLGDLAYPGDTPDLDNYKAEYDDVKSITIPVEGNHDDDDAEFANYFGAQGDASGNQISRTDLGAWSVITAETNGAPTTAEKNDFTTLVRAANSAGDKILVAMHKSPFSSPCGGCHPENESDPKQYFNIAYDNGADLVLTAHDHKYERFGAMNRAGTGTTTGGLPVIMNGAGGAHPDEGCNSRRAGSLFCAGTGATANDVSVAGFEGQLELTLRASSVDFRFIRANGTTNGVVIDSGSYATR